MRHQPEWLDRTIDWLDARFGRLQADFLRTLIDAAGFRKEIFSYGQATRNGLTVDYYTLRLSL